MKFSLVSSDNGSHITVFVNGEVHAASDEHANFKAIVAAAVAGQEEGIAELFDATKAVSAKFERYSERVTVNAGRVFFDGVEIDNALTKQIARFLDEGVDDFKPLVKYFENVMNNPQEYSREQLYRWLVDKEITITEDGLIYAYKGVVRVDDDTFKSTRSGHALVNGEEVNDYVTQRIGDLVEMPRDEVAFDPARACSSGLHVGNYAYAKQYGNVVIGVLVNPRDAVSVPSDSSSQKMRVCRYVVKEVVSEDYGKAVYASEPDEDYDEDPYCPECGNYLNAEDWCDNCEGDDYTDTPVYAQTLSNQKAVDTRLNHTRQKRGPDGRFLPKR